MLTDKQVVQLLSNILFFNVYYFNMSLYIVSIPWQMLSYSIDKGT